MGGLKEERRLTSDLNICVLNIEEVMIKRHLVFDAFKTITSVNLN